jgi:phasin family protein
MFIYIQPFASSAVRAQFDAQLFLTMDVSRQMLQGVQKLNELNLQVVKTLFKESVSSAQQFLTIANNNEIQVIDEVQSPPPAEKILAYQQHVQNILTETQVGIAETIESHVPETVRATDEVVSEVVQKVSEETSKAIQRQTQALEQLAKPIMAAADMATNITDKQG